MPFLPQEGPLLERRRACSWSLKGVLPNGEWIVCWKLLTFSMSKFSILSRKCTLYLSCWWGFSLTERTEFTEFFGAQFRAHRRPPAYRVHRALLLKVAVRFCVIGWLNVSVKLCVFCSSVLFCEKENAPTLWDDTQTTRWGVFSLTELTDLTDPLCALFRTHRTPPAYRYHRALLLMKIPIRRQKAAYIQPIGVSRWLLPFPSGEEMGEGQHFSTCLKLWGKIKRTSDRWCCNKWRTESCCKSFSYFLKPVPAF